jgi:4'-phosphopantetheinyl transferase
MGNASGFKPPAGEVWATTIDLASAPSLGPDALAALERRLDPDTRLRARRLALACDRARFVLANAGLRHWLAQAIGCRAEDVRFRNGPFGKPFLSTGDGLFFNMSHSRSMALLAWSAAEVGVDIEDVRLDIDELGIASSAFSPNEQRRLMALPPGDARKAWFFRLWTKKEAILKTLGTGLSRDPSEVDGLDDGPEAQSWIDGATHRRLTVRELDVGTTRKAAIAIEGELARVLMIPPPRPWRL